VERKIDVEWAATQRRVSGKDRVHTDDRLAIGPDHFRAFIENTNIRSLEARRKVNAADGALVR